MDTIVSALHAFDSVGTEYVAHPETQIKAVNGLQAELNKIIKAITVSGGTITLTKTDGTTFTATIGNATTSAAGLMSASDKSKLDGIATNANNYSLPTASASTLGGVKVGSGLSISSGVLSATASGGVTGVKGSSESSYRFGNVNLTAANVGAAASSHTHAASDITSGTLPVTRGGTGTTTGFPNVYSSFENLNCDECTSSGIYELAAGASIANAPEGINSIKLLFVTRDFRSWYDIYQIMFAFQGIYYRIYSQQAKRWDIGLKFY